MQKQKVKEFKEPVKRVLAAVDVNDVFNWKGIGLVSFQRWKRGNRSCEAIAIETGQRWNLKNVDHAKEISVVGIHIQEERKTDIDKLKKGDLFVIQIKKDSILLKYMDRKPSGKVVACNPMDESLTFTVDTSFTMTLIENIGK